MSEQYTDSTMHAATIKVKKVFTECITIIKFQFSARR